MTNESSNDKHIRQLLQREYRAADFPKHELRSRIEGTLRESGSGGALYSVAGTIFRHPLARTLLTVAAAILIFVAGSEYGRRVATSAASQSAEEHAEISAPLSIQTAGSAYVARLAEFRSRAPELSEARRQEARQVALAILYAATIELLKESDEDDLLAAVAQLIFSRRQSQRYPEPTDVIWF